MNDMKKLIAVLSLALLGLGFSSQVKATDTVSIANPQVREAFNDYFNGASDVAWFATSQNYVAHFNMMGSNVKAYFDHDGHLLFTSRAIDPNQLSLKLLHQLQKKYSGNQVRYVTEYSKDGISTYVITLESATKWTTLKTNYSGQLIKVDQFNKA
jgi:hypothetical protein